MSNLCASGRGNYSLNPSALRFEASVQGILSCNSEGLGCEGGAERAVADAFRKVGIIKEDSFPYKCGGGDAMQHFSNVRTTCTAAPWGASCPSSALKEPRCFFDGLARYSGEASIISGFLLGTAQSMSLLVYSNLMTYKGGVYTSVVGSPLGGHAITGLGYGVENGVKYWLIQNSWGPAWGENGYARVQRGIKLATIEDVAFIMKAYVDGGSMLACWDSLFSGLKTSTGTSASCTASSRYCSHSSLGPMVTDNCPVTCKKPGCDDSRRLAAGYLTAGSATATTTTAGSAGTVAKTAAAGVATTTAATTTLATTTASTTATTIATTTLRGTTPNSQCKDGTVSGVTMSGSPIPCSQAKPYCTNAQSGSMVSANCPLTCQAYPCVCKDFPDPGIVVAGSKLSCANVKSRGFCSQAIAKNRCPVTCSVCT